MQISKNQNFRKKQADIKDFFGNILKVFLENCHNYYFFWLIFATKKILNQYAAKYQTLLRNHRELYQGYGRRPCGLSW
jgi:hypothetical protein